MLNKTVAQKEGRYVVYVLHYSVGYGNIMNGLVSALLLAMVTNRALAFAIHTCDSCSVLFEVFMY